MYRWLEELGGENAQEDEVKVGGKEMSESDGESLALARRKKAKFSPSFKAAVLAAYASVGPAQAARQFGVTQGLLMQWRRKAGVPKFTDGLKIISDKCNAVPVKIPEESLGAKQESRDDWTKGKGTKPSRRGLKKPFYSAELRKRVLDHYR